MPQAYRWVDCGKGLAPYLPKLLLANIVTNLLARCRYSCTKGHPEVHTGSYKINHFCGGPPTLMREAPYLIVANVRSSAKALHDSICQCQLPSQQANARSVKVRR